MEENNLGPNSNFIPKIFAGADTKNKITPKEIKDKDLREAAQKRDIAKVNNKITKKQPNRNMSYGLNPEMNTIFQKGKDKVYGTIDLLKTKID
jgi:hypothetical protein|tara:strand:- start:187 stop:465 length:279 start_codon:yes stop_codon:yes gene_type:complete